MLNLQRQAFNFVKSEEKNAGLTQRDLSGDPIPVAFCILAHNQERYTHFPKEI
jgi:hypothetical protein